MVVNCVVQGCESVWSPISNIKFHGFPKDKDRREEWLAILPLKNKFYASAKVCHLHFKETDYETRNKLKPSANPVFGNVKVEVEVEFEEASPEHNDMSVSENSYSAPNMYTEEREFVAVDTMTSRAENFEDRIKTCQITYEGMTPLRYNKGIQVKLKTDQEELLRKKNRVLMKRLSRKMKEIEKLESSIEILNNKLRGKQQTNQNLLVKFRKESDVNQRTNMT